MATTASAGLRYPASTAVPNVTQDIQNLANDLDQKVIVQVANTTARNALTKYDGQRVYEQSTKRTFRWDGTNTRWEQEAGPPYTWTPTIVALDGSPVTGTITARGTYTIQGAFIDFKADLLFQGSIDGRSGVLRLQMPAGAVARSAEPEQHTISSYLYNSVQSVGWAGTGSPVPGLQQVAIEFPISATDCRLSLFRNATSAGATNTGVPLVPGSYPLTAGSRLAVWGRHELQSWAAL